MLPALQRLTALLPRPAPRIGNSWDTQRSEGVSSCETLTCPQRTVTIPYLVCCPGMAAQDYRGRLCFGAHPLLNSPPAIRTGPKRVHLKANRLSVRGVVSSDQGRGLPAEVGRVYGRDF